MRSALRLLSDKTYIIIFFRFFNGYFPNLKNPKNFNEKIQWYKLNYRNHEMTRLVDKYEVREYVIEKGYDYILNDLYGVYDSYDKIVFSELPDKFVLKATHGFNMNIICKDKGNFDFGLCYLEVEKWLRHQHFEDGREWAYKNVVPRIVCEKYLENKEYDELVDYKFYCFNGQPEVVWVCAGRYGEGGVRYTAYDMEWQELRLFKGKPPTRLDLAIPQNFAEMHQVAMDLSAGFPFVRVDLYSVENQTVFGEMTFYPDSGLFDFSPGEYNEYFGDLFRLPCDLK